MNEFKKKGYIEIKEFMKSPKKLYNYTLKDYKNEDFKDEQVMNTPSFYNDKKMVKLHIEFLPLVEKHTGKKLSKTYCYYRRYKKGDILRIHSDRPACEISVTLHLGRKGMAWPLWIVNYDEDANMVLQEPGDAIIYRGCDLKHWRPKNLYADNYSQLFLHYVDKNGPNAWAENDLYKANPNSN